MINRETAVFCSGCDISDRATKKVGKPTKKVGKKMKKLREHKANTKKYVYLYD